MLKRPPDFVIGGTESPYLRRWWVIPRNRIFNIYLHHFLRDDDDRALHDHPWWSCSIVLRGGYSEVTPTRPEGTWRRPGAIVLRRATAAHRIVLARDAEGRALPAWTIFITGRRRREWGFHCPRGWVHWRAFTAGPAGETVGKGCDQ